MTDTWTLRLPYTTPPLSLNQRLHHMVKARITVDVKDATGLLVRAAKVPACEHIRVTLHYVPRDNRRRDADNLVATSKVCLDAIVRAGVVPDDNPQYVDHRMPIIELANPKDPHLWVEIVRTK